MPELDNFPSLNEARNPDQGLNGPADPAQIQHSILEEQVELWWFRDPRKSVLCYCIAVLLILGCGLGGVGLLSTTTSVSSEWRLGAGTALCLLALGVLLKQLLSSAVQDMNCVRSRQQIDMLKSGGLSDILVVLITGLSLLICGGVLLHLALANHMPKPGQALNDMYISGVVLLAGGGARKYIMPLSLCILCVCAQSLFRVVVRCILFVLITLDVCLESDRSPPVVKLTAWMEFRRAHSCV
uniref:Transmembrane protein 125 n=1 Tax=Kryptolebias marmoratus TaxID=37003 RepID=A0A3Q3FPI0_KRYMA